jgi:hypothetical protein
MTALRQEQPFDGRFLNFHGQDSFFRSNRWLAVIRISLKDEAIKALHLAAPRYGGA